MTTAQTTTLQGTPVTRLEIHIPNVGVSFAECRLAARVLLSGKVTIQWGDVSIEGTIDAPASGSYVAQSSCRVVFGANGWGKLVPRWWYHADNGVNTSKVAQEVAQEVGETLGEFKPGAAKFGNDYVRRVCAASQVIEDCAGGVPWWVDFDGKTYVGPRPASVPDPEKFHLLDFDPITREASIGLEDARAIVIGSTITDDRLDAPITVREMVIVSEGNTLKCTAWCGGTENESSRLAGSFKRLVQHAGGARIPYKVRYRVIGMADDGRVKLQVVNKKRGFPDAPLVRQLPGVAGAFARLKVGAIVLVEFIEGNPDLPVLCPGSTPDDPGFVPDFLALGTNNPDDAIPAVRVGDVVASGGIGTLCQFATPAGVPLNLCNGTTPVPGPYLVSFSEVPPTPTMATPLYGGPTSGSEKVGIAT